MLIGKKVLVNSLFIYIKLIITIVVGLYSVRIVLNCLGEEDFGLYSVVGGTVAALSFLQSAMSNSSLRYISFNLGKSSQQAKKVFETISLLHLAIAVVLALFLESLAFPVFNYLLDVPESRISDGYIVYHCFVFTTFLSIISSPYDAMITAKEDIKQLAIIDTMGVIATLFLAFSLYISPVTPLIMYAIGIAFIQLCLRVVKQLYAINKYEEIKLSIDISVFDKFLAKEILAFCSWNILGSLAAISVTSLRGMIMNHFFALRYNAAEGISQQVGAKLSQFSGSISQALLPKIFKSEGASNHSQMLYTMLISTKITSFLYAIIAVPVWIYLPFILELWLGNVPQFCIVFLRIAIIASFVEKLSFEVTNALRAVGDIKGFQTTESLVIFLGPIFGFILFSCGAPVFSIYLVFLGASVLCMGVRLFFGHKKCGLNVWSFLIDITKSNVIPTLIIAAIYYCAYMSLPINFINIIFIGFFVSFIFILLFYQLGISFDEKKRLIAIIEDKIISKWKK